MMHQNYRKAIKYKKTPRFDQKEIGNYYFFEACEYTNMGWHGSITHLEAKNIGTLT
jgi:hypothetical protein